MRSFVVMYTVYTSARSGVKRRFRAWRNPARLGSWGAGEVTGLWGIRMLKTYVTAVSALGLALAVAAPVMAQDAQAPIAVPPVPRSEAPPAPLSAPPSQVIDGPPPPSVAIPQAESVPPPPSIPMPPPPIPVPPIPIDGPMLVSLVNSARDGVPSQESELGERYLNGRDIPQDYTLAAAWLQRAADHGDGWAEFHLGQMYRLGEGFPKDDARAADCYRKAADQGLGVAQSQLGRMFDSGQGVAMDEMQAYVWLDLATKATDGRIFGDGFIEDRDAARSHLTADQMTQAEAMEKAWTPAAPSPWQQAEAGGRAADDGKAGDAVARLTPLATDGNPLAQYTLGVMYALGEGVTKDGAQGVAWLEKSAGQGNAGAQYFLGMMYLDGDGVAKDEGKAVKWLQKAADQHVGGAESGLGIAYLSGHGVKTNLATAADWFQKAAAQGDGSAQYFLAQFYFIGQGVPADGMQAYKWASLATLYARSPELKADATKVAGQILSRIGASQAVEARKEAKDWKPVFPGP